MSRVISQRRRRKSGGNVMMEFALLAPVMFLLVFGVSDFARLNSTSNIVANAAMAGTQFGSMSPAHYDPDGMKSAALADAQEDPATTTMTVTASQFCACGIGGAVIACPATCDSGVTPETYLEVDVSKPFSTFVTFPGIPNTTTVSSKSILRVQ
jgi:Flp pilus assembly protein TadG